MIGPTFGAELLAQDLGEGIAWSSDGELSFSESVSEADRALARSVLEKHNPNMIATPAPTLEAKLLAFVVTLPNCPDDLKDAANAVAPSKSTTL